MPIERNQTFGTILVGAQINGQAAVLILDTGSNVTIVSPEISGLRVPDLKRVGTPIKGSGFVGNARWGSVNLSIATKQWTKRRVLVEDVQTISQAYKQRVDGILGEDVLSEFEYVTIDFRSKTLTLGF
jgi:hypothetical protein